MFFSFFKLFRILFFVNYEMIIFLTFLRQL